MLERIADGRTDLVFPLAMVRILRRRVRHPVFARERRNSKIARRRLRPERRRLSRTLAPLSVPPRTGCRRQLSRTRHGRNPVARCVVVYPPSATLGRQGSARSRCRPPIAKRFPSSKPEPSCATAAPRARPHCTAPPPSPARKQSNFCSTAARKSTPKTRTATRPSAGPVGISGPMRFCENFATGSFPFVPTASPWKPISSASRAPSRFRGGRHPHARRSASRVYGTLSPGNADATTSAAPAYNNVSAT